MGEGNAKRPGLGHLLGGIHHVGVTVDDLAKSLEFYVEVLGGKPCLSGDGFAGEKLQQTLFQRELLDAAAGRVGAMNGTASVGDGADKLDVRMISFGHTLVELLHFRDGNASPAAPGSIPAGSSAVGANAAVHICFAVREEVDLNRFALDLEAECRARDIPLTCNRTVAVASEAERRDAPAAIAANKFWNDPRYPGAEMDETAFGDFLGLGFFYCKGPNGEQLEFAQATRKAKAAMQQAGARYDSAIA
jgi:catechol 2,3-dioxygenase-like lactoylglutathione lyase family enzyme